MNNKIQELANKIKYPVLIKKKENLHYLTGRDFERGADEYLLITKNRAVGFGSGLEKITWVKKTDRLKNIAKYLGRAKQLDIEYGFTYGEGGYLKSKLRALNVKIKPVRSAADVMRMVKMPAEIAKIKKSMEIVEKVFYLVKREIKKPGMTEKKLADFIKVMGLKFGAGDVSFPPIVAAGANAAVPHHLPGNYRLRQNQSIIIDMGFKYQNYCSDFTRTIFLKSVPRKLEEAYNQVEKAYNGAMALFLPSRPSPNAPPKADEGERRDLLLTDSSTSLRPVRNGKSVTGNDVYQLAVDVLAEKHLEKYFIHSLGHGTGLEIHELPNLSPKSKDILKDGMVFSIEPGVYLPKAGGIRIEDLVYLEQGKVKKFINVPTGLADNIL